MQNNQNNQAQNQLPNQIPNQNLGQNVQPINPFLNNLANAAGIPQHIQNQHNFALNNIENIHEEEVKRQSPGRTSPRR